MAVSVYERIMDCAAVLGIEITEAEIAFFANSNSLQAADMELINTMFEFLKARKEESVINTLINTSRLPKKNPKTFDNFDFGRIHGKDIAPLAALPSLSAIYAHKNLAFIGPQGVGKTHLAQAFGRACCEKGLKTYFMKASELNQKFTNARRYGRDSINFLVKPSCLIIDEVGRCKFDAENTRMFFDLIDRRYSKEGPNCMIFTSNKDPNAWAEYFASDSDLLCSLDRIFDDASVFLIKGESYRGRKLETFKFEAGESAVPKPVRPVIQ